MDEIKLLYADDRVVVCIKPAGVLSTDEPGGMPERLRAALGGPEAVVRSVHRLDRVVGGVMVYARTRRAAAELGRQIEDGTLRKEYLAVVHGRPAGETGSLRDRLHRDRAERKTYIVPEGTPQSQEAVLGYELLEERAGLSLLRVRLETGRTHQIRCQLAGHGTPIAGDVKYGAPEAPYGVALCSHKLRFLHPRTGEEMVFSYMPRWQSPFDGFDFIVSAHTISCG